MTHALAVGRQLPLRDVPMYWVAHIIGGLVAAAAAITIYSDQVE